MELKPIALRPDDLSLVVARLPCEVRGLCMKLELIVAGGFIRATLGRERASDVDLFGSKDVLVRAAEKLSEERHVGVYETENALTIAEPGRLPVQFVTGFELATPGAIVSHFDFTVSCAAVWYEKGKGWRSSCHADFYQDLAGKVLRYTGNGVPEGSILRMRKFLQRGYFIGVPDLALLVAKAVQCVDWKACDPEDVERLSFVLAGKFRELDPLTAVDLADVEGHMEGEERWDSR
jgi:hypothetical protein